MMRLATYALAWLHLTIVVFGADPRLTAMNGYQLVQLVQMIEGIEKGTKKDICKNAHNFRSVIKKKPENAKKLWEDIGAEKYIVDYIKKNGAQDWVNNMLSSTISCASNTFPADSTCPPPLPEQCKGFKPQEEAWWVQLAVVNYRAAFSKWREELQDDAIFGMAKGIKDVTEYWGPPGADDNKKDTFELVMSAILQAAAVVEVIAGKNVEKAAEAVGELQTPEDVEKDLEKQLGDTFQTLGKQIKKQIKWVFEGNRTGGGCEVDGGMEESSCQIFNQASGLGVMAMNDEMKGKQIASYFRNGFFLDSEIWAEAVTAWIDATKKQLTLALILRAWRTTKVKDYEPKDQKAYGLRVMKESEYVAMYHTKEEFKQLCNKQPWTDLDEKEGICRGIAKFVPFKKSKKEGRWYYLENKDFLQLKTSMPDPKAALKNIVDCDKKNGKAGRPEIKLDFKTVEYPECFFQLDRVTDVVTVPETIPPLDVDV